MNGAKTKHPISQREAGNYGETMWLEDFSAADIPEVIEFLQLYLKDVPMTNPSLSLTVYPATK